jgi:hypothetical protein
MPGQSVGVNSKSEVSGSDQILFAPGAVIPEIRIDGPAASAASLGERPESPGPFDLMMTPRTVTHKPHQFTTAFFTSAVVA